MVNDEYFEKEIEQIELAREQAIKIAPYYPEETTFAFINGILVMHHEDWKLVAQKMLTFYDRHPFALISCEAIRSTS